MKKSFSVFFLILSSLCNAQTYQNSETAKFITKVGDIPDTLVGHDIDTLCSCLKNTTNVSGTVWDRAKLILISPPTKNDTNSLVNLKDSTIVATLEGTNASGNKSSQTTPTTRGYSFNKSGDYINEGYIPANIYGVNSSAHFEMVLENFAGSSNFLFGSHESTSETFKLLPRSTGNSSTNDFYNTTTNQGRKVLGGGGITNTIGGWWHNRNASNYCELVVGSNVYTYTSSGGSIPNSQPLYTGCINSAGTAAGHLKKEVSIIFDSEGLTTTQRAEATQCFVDFDLRMGDRMNATKNVAWTGNSLSRYLNSGFPRQGIYYAWPEIFKYNNVAVPGQTTTTMIANYSTTTAPIFNGSYSRNDLVFWEGRNDATSSTRHAYQCDSNIYRFCNDSRTTGFYVIAVTIPVTAIPAGFTDTQWNRKIDSINVYMRDNWQTFADTLVEITDTLEWRYRSEFCNDAAYNDYCSRRRNDTNVYIDQTHMTMFGYGIPAKQVGLILKRP